MMMALQPCFRVLLLATMLGMLVACSTNLDKILPDRRPDYRASKPVDPLEVPPDLTASTIDDTLMVPELNPTSSARYSDYASERKGGGQVALSNTVLQQPPGIRVERDGDRRWLVVQQEPDKVWPKIKEFWPSSGLVLKKEDPRIGIMETDWAENRANIPDGPIHSLLSKVLDIAYSAPTRDKFRVRLERVDEGTAVYLTHYGMEEVVSGDEGVGNQKNQNTVWRSRPPDPELEAEMLNRLMVYLGAADKRTEAQLAKAAAGATKTQASLSTVDGQQALIIDEDYSRAWRLVGLALDGSNFVVEDQDRAQGRYLVEYRELANDTPDKGWLSWMAFWKDKTPPKGARYQVRLSGQGPRTVVVVQNAKGEPDDSSTAKLLLESLLKVIS